MEFIRKVDRKGRIVLPSEALAVLGCPPGAELLIYVDPAAGGGRGVELYHLRRWYQK